MAITVVDYNAGNLTSVMNALKYIGADAKVSRDPDEIAKATRFINILLILNPCNSINYFKNRNVHKNGRLQQLSSTRLKQPPSLNF